MSRFSKRRADKVGPGSYNPQLQDAHQDFNRAFTTGNFHSPVAEKMEGQTMSPAPNSYNINRTQTDRNSLITAQAAFNSKLVYNTALAKYLTQLLSPLLHQDTPQVHDSVHHLHSFSGQIWSIRKTSAPVFLLLRISIQVQVSETIHNTTQGKKKKKKIKEFASCPSSNLQRVS